MTEEQGRQQAYGELMGRKAMMAQLLVSRFEAWIYSDYYEARWKLAGKPAILRRRRVSCRRPESNVRP